MIAGAMDTSTDPGCCRAVDPEMVFGSSPGPDVTMTQVPAQTTQIGMALWQHSPQTNMTSSDGPDLRFSPSSVVSGATDISTDTGRDIDLDMSWVAAQASQISMALVAA